VNKKSRIIFIAVAVVAALAVGIFAAAKLLKRNKIYEPNITLFKCHMAMEIAESDLDGIKSVIETAAGTKVLKIEKGSIPYKESLTGEDEKEIYLGDSVTVTLPVLTEEQKVAMFSAVAEEYGLTGEHMIQMNDIYRKD